MGLTRKEIKHDEFLETATEARHWLEENWRLVGAILVGVLVLLVVVLGWRQWSASRDEAARNALAAAQARYLAVDDPFATTPVTLEEALEGFRGVAEQAGSRPAGAIARYYEGIILLRLDRPEDAVAPLESAADARDRLVGQNARVTLARAKAESGDLAAADTLLRAVAAETDGPFPPPEALTILAGLYADAGDAPKAESILDEVVERFPDSPAAQRTRASRTGTGQ